MFPGPSLSTTVYSVPDPSLDNGLCFIMCCSFNLADDVDCRLMSISCWVSVSFSLNQFWWFLCVQVCPSVLILELMMEDLNMALCVSGYVLGSSVLNTAWNFCAWNFIRTGHCCGGRSFGWSFLQTVM